MLRKNKSTLICTLVCCALFAGCSAESNSKSSSRPSESGLGLEAVEVDQSELDKEQPFQVTAASNSTVPAEPLADASVSSPPKSIHADRVVTGDWPMFGGTPGRNMVNGTTGVSLDFEPPNRRGGGGKKLIYTARLGSQTYGNPVVSGGQVYVGTNNGGEYRPKHVGDRGVMLCFEEQTGKLRWQLTRKKLPQGRVNDWPEQGICSTCVVEGDRVYVVTNRCELMCVDAQGFHDGENDGIQDEEDLEELDADIVWSLDMIDELGVFPHNLATSSPVLHEDLVLLLTSNGVDEAHLELPAPRAPSFIAVNKKTGELKWEDNSPFDQILHGQWSSPAVGIVDGQAQVYMPGGDGWLYAFDVLGGELIWKFDLNPKDSVWELGGRGTRNAIISTPVFVENSVVLAVGQDPEHGEGVGHIYRIDATKTGDISPMIEDGQDASGSTTYKPNPNSGEIWHWGGTDQDGSVTGQKRGLIFRRSISTVAIHDGLVYAPDMSGFLHCLDFGSGKRYWEYDTFSAVWGSPMVVDGNVYLGDEDGDLVILKAGKEQPPTDEELENQGRVKLFPSSIYSTPTIANGVLFITDRSQLYAFSID